MRLRVRTKPWSLLASLALVTLALADTAVAQRLASAGTNVIAADLDGAVSVEGSGPTTWVLLSGLMGGVGGFGRLKSELTRAGHRVVVVDAYRLSVDSADVTFAALARRVDAVLARHGVDSARIVGHAHGGGVALRLAADAPGRVAAVYLLDVGALPENRTKVFSSSLRLVPMLVRIPGGKSLVRGQIVRGLRQNAGSEEWIDSTTRFRYSAPLLDQPRKVVDLAGRLSRSRESEPVSSVVARLRAPVTVLLGVVPRPAGPDSSEIAVLRPLGQRLRIEELPGVGHFPHEEAPAELARRLLGPR